MKHRVLSFVPFLVAAWAASAPCRAQVHPMFLVSSADTLYRVAPGGTIETFANQPGNIIGMTTVPAGAVVTGCRAGDVIALQGGLNRDRIWRVDHARAGTPRLVEIGRAPDGLSGNDLAFAHGRLFTLEGFLFYELSTSDFSQVGSSTDLWPGETGGSGGLAFDGGFWYIAKQGAPSANRIIRFGNPPGPDNRVPLGPSGVNIGNNDLEMYGGVLWGAMNTGGRVAVGSFDVESGGFTQAVDVAASRMEMIGLAALCPADFNGDAAVNSQDFFDFLGAFFEESPGGDFNGDDAVNSQDFFDFLGAFFEESPGGDFNGDDAVNSQDFFDFLGAFFSGC